MGDLMLSGTDAGQLDRLSRLKDAATIIAVAAASFYSIGLLVANIYLSRFHYEDFSLLHPRCVVTGVWVCFVLACCALPGLWLGGLSIDEIRAKKLDTFMTIEILAVCGVVAGLLTLDILGIGEFSAAYFRISDSVDVQSTIFGWLFKWMCVLSGALVFRKAIMSAPSWRQSNKRISGLLSLSSNLLVVGALIFCLYSIATNAYSKIDSAMGGGRPRLAKLIMAKDGIPLWKALTITKDVPEEVIVSGYVYVYHETDSQLFVRLCECVRPQGDLILLDKKLVAGIIPELRDPLSIKPENPNSARNFEARH